MLAAIRVLNRLELVAETLRAALNELATVAPAWLQALPLAWYERYGKRIEERACRKARPSAMPMRRWWVRMALLLGALGLIPEVVVCTCVSRWGAVGSHVSLTCTMYRPSSVSHFWR